MTPEDPEYPEYQFDGFAGDDEEGDDDATSTAMSEVERNSLRNQMAGIHEAESLNYLESLRTTHSADILIEMIDSCVFFEATKEALRGWVRTNIGTDKLLTNTTSIDEALMKVEILLLELTATVPTHDTENPQWLTTIGNMRSAAADIIYRTFGAYRERRLQDVNRMEVVTGKLAGAPKAATEKPQKRGIRFL